MRLEAPGAAAAWPPRAVFNLNTARGQEAGLDFETVIPPREAWVNPGIHRPGRDWHAAPDGFWCHDDLVFEQGRFVFCARCDALVARAGSARYPLSRTVRHAPEAGLSERAGLWEVNKAFRDLARLSLSERAI